MADKTLKVRVITPEQSLFEGEAQAVFLPGERGSFEVLPGHASIISTLLQGSVVVRDAEGNSRELAINKGVVRVNKDEVTVCAD